MPATSSSRRRTTARAQDDSDIEDGPTQVTAREDVDEDEDEGPRRAKKEKRSLKGKSRATEAQQAVSNDDDDDDDDERIDVDNFADQPLAKADVQKINGLSSDWQTMVKTIHRSNNMVSDVAVALADNAEGEDAQKGLLELERLLKGLVDIENEMQINHDVLENLGQEVASGIEIDSIIQQYQENVQKTKESYFAKTTRQKYAKNETYRHFKESIYEIEHPGQAMPPVTELMPKEPGDDSDDDEDLEMGAVTQDYKCPLTLRPLENPFTSEVCGHSFSRDAIREYFANDRGSKDCPASGCTRSFRLSDCKPNRDLAKKIKQHERRQKKKEEEMDVEEVVE
ncbi:hypothetical protein BDP27DRAFT_1311306 [Rhodocollybia butyracea]|uniref:SP-RING-type domain-containing protein n=1 Tax=Rhodocollybia butyracea TaxID=206335 RepID=A0A9P5Q3S6_9AGAR|nr:hypothetical protein BDP27DRAFT_1311306 [Rhodocollybia butyracea]